MAMDNANPMLSCHVISCRAMSCHTDFKSSMPNGMPCFHNSRYQQCVATSGHANAMLYHGLPMSMPMSCVMMAMQCPCPCHIRQRKYEMTEFYRSCTMSSLCFVFPRIFDIWIQFCAGLKTILHISGLSSWQSSDLRRIPQNHAQLSSSERELSCAGFHGKLRKSWKSNGSRTTQLH